MAISRTKNRFLRRTCASRQTRRPQQRPFAQQHLSRGQWKLGWPRFDDSGFAVLHDADGPPELETSN